MHYWDDPSWQHHTNLMKKHQESRDAPGAPIITADERPACSGWSVCHADHVIATLAVPGLGALVLCLGEGAADGKLEWLGCRLTAR